jgi:hypothetical protein
VTVEDAITTTATEVPTTPWRPDLKKAAIIVIAAAIGVGIAALVANAGDDGDDNDTTND